MARQLAIWTLSLFACVALTFSAPRAQAQIGVDEMDAIIVDDGGPEIIRERYPNRATKIERQVKQDAGGNYVNHGPWKMWDVEGTLISEGQYDDGERDGLWTRWLRRSETDLFKRPPYKDYTGPYISQAEFNKGRLEGSWVVYDGKQRKISEIQFTDGLRDGKAVWWFPSGQIMQEIDYLEGEIDGKFLQWNADGQLTRSDNFDHGRKLAAKMTKHDTKSTRNRGKGKRATVAKKTEGMYLFAKEVVETRDDWWNAKLAIYERQGIDERHGEWMAWYSNGQTQTTGEYDHDVEVGTFTWWYSNGQKAVEGAFKDGKHHGTWTWYHQNGQKEVNGQYVSGQPTGPWSWWLEDGRVDRSADFTDGVADFVEAPAQFPDEIAQPEPVLAQPPGKIRR